MGGRGPLLAHESEGSAEFTPKPHKNGATVGTTKREVLNFIKDALVWDEVRFLDSWIIL